LLNFVDFVVKEGSQAAQPQASAFGMLVPMIAVFVIFYFMLIRPQKKQQEKHQKMITEIKKGDKVITSSGILGEIFSVEEKFFVLTIAEKTKIKILKSQIATKYSEESNNG
jgi:preprotein translocase subunit YajC